MALLYIRHMVPHFWQDPQSHHHPVVSVYAPVQSALTNLQLSVPKPYWGTTQSPYVLITYRSHCHGNRCLMLHLNSIEHEENSVQVGSSSRRVLKSHRHPGWHFPGVFLNPFDVSTGTTRVCSFFAEQLYDVLICNILKLQCIFWCLDVKLCVRLCKKSFRTAQEGMH